MIIDHLFLNTFVEKKNRIHRINVFYLVEVSPTDRRDLCASRCFYQRCWRTRWWWRTIENLALVFSFIRSFVILISVCLSSVNVLCFLFLLSLQTQVRTLQTTLCQSKVTEVDHSWSINNVHSRSSFDFC